MSNLLPWVRDNEKQTVEELMQESGHLFGHSTAEATCKAEVSGNNSHYPATVGRIQDSPTDVGKATDDPNMTTLTLKIPEGFLDDLDATWRAEDFPSRSEFIRWALRDAVQHPSFSRGGWKDTAASEHQRRTGDGETYSSDEVRARLNEDADDSE